jgi:glutamate dehydrogenase (NAD(P)+)
MVEGANIPITQDAEAELHRRHVLVIPDFIANAGGVICAAVEYRGGTQTMALATIEEKMALPQTRCNGSAERTGFDRGSITLPREHDDAAGQIRHARTSCA